jgi:large subunit ribosomal protein L25
MAGERIRLEVQDRDEHGSPASRRLRERGLIPGVLYGSGKDAHSFCVHERELRRVLAGEHGRHTILDVVLEGQQRAHHAVLKDFQVDPLRSKLLHIDLQEVRLDQPIQSQVVVELVGTPEGVVQGGVLSQVAREVNVEALPMEVPDRLQLDVSGMSIGDSLRLADLSAPEGVTLLDDEELVLATVTPPTRVEEPEEEAAEEEGEEAAAEGAAEEAPEAAQGADGESETSGE